MKDNYQKCCPKSMFGSKNSSPYCKQLDLNFTIRSIGSVGSIVSYGSFGYIKNSGLNFEGSNFVTITPLDTTILNTIDITVEWNTNNSGNSIYSDIFVLNKIY